MAQTLKTALLQLNVGPDIADNLKTTEGFIREAAGAGARFILTPENTCHMRSPAAEKLQTALAEKDHPVIASFAALARETGAWILAGSVSVKVAPDKIANRSLLFDAKGDIVAKYDKIHLFDVDLPTGESHRESALVAPGGRAVLAASPWGPVGLTICYDMRFPGLYRALAQAGARLLTAPSAFTVPTGKAHWESLLRARAIENGAFVLAPAQAGTHHGGRQTYGHSLAVDPWGQVIAEGDALTPGPVYATLDLEAVDRARQAIPSLKHDRPYQAV